MANLSGCYCVRRTLLRGRCALVATLMARSPTRFHGELPPPGVWHAEGHGAREGKMSFSKTFIPKHEIAMDAKGGGDFVYANSFFQNGTVASSQDGVRSRDLHLGHDLVPLAGAPSGLTPSRSSSNHATARHPSPPGRRISAIEFDDGHSPQRVPVDGAWRLTSTLSSPDIATVQHHPGMARRVVPQQERSMQLVNRRLWVERGEGGRVDRQRTVAAERAALAEFPPRWGFLETANFAELAIRRRAPAQEHTSRPTLPGCQGLTIGAPVRA